MKSSKKSGPRIPSEAPGYWADRYRYEALAPITAVWHTASSDASEASVLHMTKHIAE